MENKNIKLTIRLSKKEHSELLKRKPDEESFAGWLRRIGLNEKPKKPIKKIDPALLYELNKIGINLNQIAKNINGREGTFEKFDLLLQLQLISDTLQEILKNAC